jgi:DNA-binding transcriptional ArsR family regulator
MEAATAAPKTKLTSPEVPQHLRALERANKVRLARAELKRAIARGERDAAEVICDCPWQATSMSIAELLTSQRRWGPTRARKFLIPLRIAEDKELGTLTERQRRLVMVELARRSPNSASVLEYGDGAVA